VHYHFWTRERFVRAIDHGELLEWAQVYGNWYGTLKSEVEPYLRQGISVLMELDVEGAKQVRRQYPDAVLIFIRAPSLEAYERRLRERKSGEDEATLQKRLSAARHELACAVEYDQRCAATSGRGWTCWMS
jgi:guanylate kinase